MSFWMNLAVLVACWLTYIVALTVYRATLHPLANFPGPKLAGASYLYEFWFDVILGGRYTWEIKKLHDRYGPIVRISPDELHCNDPDFVDEIYASGNRNREKSEHFCGAFFPKFRMSGLCTKDHHHHRLRRRAVNKFFSRQSITKWEGLVHENAQKLCDKLLSYREREPFQAVDAYSCFTTDVITAYCFGSGTGFLDQPNWTPNYRRALELLEGWNNTFRHLPWLCSAIGRIPPYVDCEAGFQWHAESYHSSDVTIPNQIEAIRSRSKESNEPTTILPELLQSDLPPSEKTTERLTIEANVITFGGTETVAITLSSLTWHILSNPAVFQKLHGELSTLVAETRHLPSWSTLEKSQYLTCVILEGLRLGSGSAGRQARVAPDEDLVYRSRSSDDRRSSLVSYVIPRGYAIGMSPYLMHTNEDVFPNALKFDPERWLDSKGDRRTDLEHHFMAFSKGNRQCLGIQLAFCELYIGVAAIVLRAMPSMAIYNTTSADMDYDHDEGIGKPRKGSKGLRIRMVDDQEE